jgi:CheY-like chemotaxis protein
MPKILVIEDNELNRKVLVRRFNRYPYELIVAADGEEGLALARANPPDLILMDMQMPGVDGFEATKQLRALRETASIPIIALTAHAMVGDREKFLAAGCDEYEPKPVDMNSLIAKIEALLARAT